MTPSFISYTFFLQQGGDKDKEKKKKETILDLAKYLDKTIRVKFSGGREGWYSPDYVSTEQFTVDAFF